VHVQILLYKIKSINSQRFSEYISPVMFNINKLYIQNM